MRCTLLVRPSKRAWFPGGDVAFLRALKAIEKLVGANDDQTTGIEILAPGPLDRGAAASDRGERR
jgi:hypothetical protein